MKKIIIAVVVAVIWLIGNAAFAATPIRTLGTSPWLGQIKSSRDLVKKVKAEKNNIASFIVYDLKEEGVSLNYEEALAIVNAMVKEGFVDVTIPDGTQFLSMGWKTAAGQVMRTEKPILYLGRVVKAYLFFGQIGLTEFKYVVLADCGNICLREMYTIEADVVPTGQTVITQQQPQAPSQAPSVVTRVVNIVLSLPPPPMSGERCGGYYDSGYRGYYPRNHGIYRGYTPRRGGGCYPPRRPGVRTR